jgi:hypothetical protein
VYPNARIAEAAHQNYAAMPGSGGIISFIHFYSRKAEQKFFTAFVENLEKDEFLTGVIY